MLGASHGASYDVGYVQYPLIPYIQIMVFRLTKPDPNWKPTEADKKLMEEMQRTGFLPSIDGKPSRRKKSMLEGAITGLQQARTEALKQAGWVQDLFFGAWIHNCVETADDPRHWTQARVLYENYLQRARRFSLKQHRLEKQAALEVLATETQWGRWMATRYPKKRRTAGFYYPLRLK
jgi:hypothetical protein